MRRRGEGEPDTASWFLNSICEKSSYFVIFFFAAGFLALDVLDVEDFLAPVFGAIVSILLEVKADHRTIRLFPAR
jgi:hypothetical protein